MPWIQIADHLCGINDLRGLLDETVERIGSLDIGALPLSESLPY